MNLLTLSIIFGGILILGGVVLVGTSLRSIRGDEFSKRLNDFVVERDRTKTDKAPLPIQQVFSENLLNRTIMPAAKNLFAYFGRLTPKYEMEKLERQLTIARNPFNLKARDFYGVKLALLFLGLLLAFLLNYRNFNQIISLMTPRSGFSILFFISNFSNSIMINVYLGLLLIILLYLTPTLYLSLRVKQIQDEVRRGLPDVLDMLSVCTSAGLGFDQAVQRVSEYWQNSVGFEFRRVVSEMEVGVSRTDALRNMADRLDVVELSSFVAIIIQSEALGMRIADVLHSQSEQMRVMRQLKAKEIAYRLPAKMIVPLALLIMPALMAVILAPLLPRLLGLLH